MKRNILWLLTLFVIADVTWAQTQEQILKYRIEPYGDKTYRKKL